MRRSIRNTLVAGAVVIAGVGVAGATLQALKPAGGQASARSSAHSHGRGGSRLFAEYDLNKDGKIARDEFNKVAAQHFIEAIHGGKTMNEQQFAAFRALSLQQHSDQIFRRADWNGDGKLNFDEFANPIRASFERADQQSAGFIACRQRQEDRAMQGRAAGSGERQGRRRSGSRGAGSFCGRDDLNHDGKVTRLELDQALQQQFAAAAKGGKFLTRDQLLAMQRSRSRDTSGHTFQRLDHDHDGKLTLQEFAESEQRLFTRLDRNGDGVITRDDFSSSRHNRGGSRTTRG